MSITLIYEGKFSCYMCYPGIYSETYYEGVKSRAFKGGSSRVCFA